MNFIQNTIIGKVIAATVAHCDNHNLPGTKKAVELSGKQGLACHDLIAAGVLQLDECDGIELTVEWEGRFVVTGELDCLKSSLWGWNPFLQRHGGLWAVSSYSNEARGVTVKVAVNAYGASVINFSSECGISDWHFNKSKSMTPFAQMVRGSAIPAEFAYDALV